MVVSAPATGYNPIIGLDLNMLQQEIDDYHLWMDERADEAYAIAEKARSKGLDHQTFVEIPRASDLAGRTEKLLINHLDGLEIADDIRIMLANEDRETTAIRMAEQVAIRCRDEGRGTQMSIDVGLRVGLAILTEAVLVAPLEGISEVRLLSNLDGSQFVSIHFAGPIRAAGGTAQALAVLIADMIRRKLGIDSYKPSQPEIERVKEEFALYRGNLQYRPSPEEIQEIVKACPVMINGESTESIVCAGYGRVRNIDEPRIRGGVLLVIGEGMCLKAPKIQRHTERMNVPGWDFISKFANRNKEEESGDKHGFKSRQVPKIKKFMEDIIAGRPVFGSPSRAGGFRLRYGRARPSGLAAASCNAASMVVMDDFLAVGTQMKIERPGKACAVTPCDVADGPWVILDDGRFLRFDDADSLGLMRHKISSIWDNGEIIIGYGEFLENNKKLVPSGYNIDWWAADLLEELSSEKDVGDFCDIIGMKRGTLPAGFPGGVITAASGWHAKRKWFDALRLCLPDWASSKAISLRFKTSLPPPNNPWWKDLPLEWISAISTMITSATIENTPKITLEDGVKVYPAPEVKCLRIKGGVARWNSQLMAALLPEREDEYLWREIPGEKYAIADDIFPESMNSHWVLRLHGLAKATALILGLRHHHEGDDLVITSGWQAMLDGLGFGVDGDLPRQIAEVIPLAEERISSLRNAFVIIGEEKERLEILNREKSSARIAAETNARQKGLNIAETDAIGRRAADEVVDDGCKNAKALLKSQILYDDHLIDGSLWIARKISDLRLEHAAPVRIGTRMGRPEKAAPREKPVVHSLFPLDINGGNQRLMKNALLKKEIRVQLGLRKCSKCGRRSPMLRCHHRRRDNIGEKIIGETCGGRTESDVSSQRKGSRRRGELQTVPIEDIAEDARINLGLDRIPEQMKCLKKLMSRDQTPEAMEKGFLRAKFKLPVFRDGTVRYDMSDVPLSHFTPHEIGVPWKIIKDLGYLRDIEGEELLDDQQMLEILPQDFVVAKGATDHLVRTACFIDELLKRFYGMDAFYHVSEPLDLVGHQIIALAPHTSGGVLGRIIGWSNTSGGYAHPMFHAAKRRNCDGDEDAILLLMDGLLNFSRDILPANRGGQMDAPLVLTTRLNPTEVDKEALNVDSAWFYERGFYESTLNQPHPKEIQGMMDFVERRLGTVAAVRGYGYTHSCSNISQGPPLSAYKTLETMIDKMNGQLRLGQKLRGVDVRVVASSVIRSHFLPDLRGNLVAFTKQKVRCLSCGHSYRRMPLASKCIQPARLNSGSQRFGSVEEKMCHGNLALTVTEGAVRKYIQVTRHVMDTYGVDNYTRQNVEWLADSVESLFNNDKVKQMSLSDFL
jgi:hypothetical protein